MVALGAVLVRRVGPDEPKPPLVSSLHTVDKKGADKFRLCLDAKRVNRYIHLRSFRYQTLDQVIELLRRYPNCWLVSYDLRKGYYHIALCMLTACILAFKWTIGGVTHYYVYQALPFGVAAACYIFTKVMRAFAKYWLVLAGVLLCTYIDDGLFICETLEEAILVSLHLQYLGVLLGLTFSDKTRFTPSQDREHLGLVLDTARGRCYLPEKKLRKLLAVLELLRGATAAPAVELQRIAGSLNAARHAFVGAALVSRPLTAAVAQADAAGARGQLAMAHVPLGPLQQQVISWLLEYLPSAPPAPLWRPSKAFRLFTDASGTGFCAALDIDATADPLALNSRDFCCTFGCWSPELAGEDNCWRELRAVLIAATELFPRLSPGSHVVARVDNSSAVAAALRGSVNEGMMDLALQLFSACIRAQVTLEAVHVRGKDNVALALAAGLGRARPELPHVHIFNRHGPPFVGSLPVDGSIVTVDWQLRARFLNWLQEYGWQSAGPVVWLIQRQPAALEWRPLVALAAARGWLLAPLPAGRGPRHLFFSAPSKGAIGLGRSPWPLWICAPAPAATLIEALAAQELPADALLPPPQRPPPLSSPPSSEAQAAVPLQDATLFLWPPRAPPAPPEPRPVGAGRGATGPSPRAAPASAPAAGGPARQARQAELRAAAHAWEGYAHSSGTQAEYARIYRRFITFCTEIDCPPHGAESVRLYVANLALEGKQWSTLTKYLAAVRCGLAAAGTPLPPGSFSDRDLRGIEMTARRAAETARTFRPEEVRRWITSDDFLRRGTAVQLRDLALVLTMIFGWFRYDDACRRLRLRDVVEAADRGAMRPGLTFLVPADKTNQPRRGPLADGVVGGGGARAVTISDMPELGLLDPARALRRYLSSFTAAQRASSRPLFANEQGAELSYCYVNGIPKRMAEAVGLQPDGYSSHSFRRTGTTWAALGGAEKRVLDVHGRWSHSGTTAEHYVDAATELSGQACMHMERYIRLRGALPGGRP
eukprot:tig00000581_g2231.t1